MATSGTHLSREFFELLKAIGESKSKQEEDRIVQREILVLKKKMETPIASEKGGMKPHQQLLVNHKKRAKEFLVRLLYVEMLGHDANFGYIKAVELAASSLITHKRVGYLVCSSCLPPEHEFRFMLVNQMQRDLNSSHVLECCASLLAVTKIITSDMVPAICGDVAKLLNHSNETVRKKAIVALHRFHQIAPDCVTATELTEKLRRVLCDRDPSVMGASLAVIYGMALVDPAPFKDLVPSLVSILKQICEHRLPSDYDYHRVPAPWMQMAIVKILGVLGSNDAAASSGMYEILGECMAAADVGINVGFAITYECVRTVVAIYPNPTLLDAAADAISRFIGSRSQNLKYLGVTGLAAIVEQHPRYAAQHQLAVIECLEDRKDDTLQRKTLELLYKMTNPINVEFIARKLLDFLRDTTDPYLRQSLTGRICRIAERYAPTNAWYIRTVTELMEVGGDLVTTDVAQNLMGLVAEGEDEDVRMEAVERCVSLLDRAAEGSQPLPRILVETVAWVLGEYGYLSKEHNLLEKLCSTMSKNRRNGGVGQGGASAGGYFQGVAGSGGSTGSNGIASNDSTTRRTTATAIMKLVAQAGTCPPVAAHIIDDCSRSRDTDLQQRSLEFQNLLTGAAHLLGEVLPVDASTEDLEADPCLTFLDAYVANAVREGASPYAPPEDDDDDDDDFVGGSSSALTSQKSSAFNFTAYEKPQKPTQVNYHLGSAGSNDKAVHSNGTVNLPPGAKPVMGGAVAQTQVNNIAEPQLVLRGATANVWGKGGLNTGATPAAPPAAAAPPPAPARYEYGGYNASVSTSTHPVAAPTKPREMTEKERMAAALFGGIVPGAVPPPSPSPASAPKPAPAPLPKAPAQAPPPAPPVVAPAPPPVPTPAPAPAPSATFDLLDFSDPAPVAAPTPAAAPTIATLMDPFGVGAASTNKTASSSPVFTYGGVVMIPLSSYTTPQFGATWGTLVHSAPQSLTGCSSFTTFDSALVRLKEAGLHTVEAIATTSEGILAAMVGEQLILVHAKVGTLSSIDLLVKCADADLGMALSSHLAGYLR